ncbi:hypothetical protein [Thalassospira lucentensis]|uniref:hypothetical protein n=1 Tax=Thalassospira lucentensis TaxID=168935 RepID=UPI0029422099|nr:hypothetical protein [Thalassospira lucentensis]WOI11576.1 hypothetical protein R1T41_03110 [Thalassospira lucentensis]
MGAIFSFHYSMSGGSVSDRIVIMFCGEGFDSDEYEDTVKFVTDRGLCPHKIVLILNETDYASVLRRPKEIEKKSLPVNNKSDIYLLKFDSKGELLGLKRISSWERCSSDLVVSCGFRSSLIRQGMTQIFRKRSAMLDAGHTAYFTNSQKIGQNEKDRRRCFLRASNALSEGSEVLFIAFSLLPYMGNGLTRVHVDTSTITSVIYASFLLRKGGSFPQVHNFKSYQGIEEHVFNLGEKNLVIISASQSGKLFEKIKNKFDEKTKILTLFKLSDEVSPEENVICDLRKDKETNPNGYKVQPVLDSDRVKGARPLRMLGEQFVVGLSQAKGVTPSKVDLPKATRDILQSMLGQSIFSCFCVGYEDSVYPLWVRPKNIVACKAFKDWIEDIVRRNIPVSVSAIIELDGDEGSKSAAQIINDAIEEELGKSIKIISSSQLDSVQELKESNGAIIVVGGAIGRGRKFLQISQSLRDVAPKSHRIYLSGICMTESVKDTKFLESNLEYKRHSFLRLLDLHIPRRENFCSWKEENQLVSIIIDEVEDWEDSRGELVRKFFINRRNQLQDDGLIDNVFLNSVDDVAYHLRDNFAFVEEGFSCESISQADVYAVASTLLHRLRLDDTVDRASQLVNNEFEHSVLSPTTFARYNDGVIQAAFLRAALPVELNFLENDNFSKQMGDLIIDCLNDRNKPQGEAVLEFLLALILGRLKLQTEDMERIRNKCASLESFDIADFMLDVLFRRTEVATRVNSSLYGE